MRADLQERGRAGQGQGVRHVWARSWLVAADSHGWNPSQVLGTFNVLSYAATAGLA